MKKGTQRLNPKGWQTVSGGREGPGARPPETASWFIPHPSGVPASSRPKPHSPACAASVRIFIHEGCTRLAESLRSLQHDPNRPEDVLKVDADEYGVGGDDAADCLGYLVATKSRTVTQRKLSGL